MRWRNGLSVARLRIGLRVTTLAIWLYSALGGGSPVVAERTYWVAAAVASGHLALGVGALIGLERRWRVPQVLLVMALADVAAVAFAAWRTPPGDAMSIGFLMGAMELMLLFAALVLPRRTAGWLAAAATVYLVAVGVRLGLDPGFLRAVAVTLAGFAVAVTWAGTRMVSLAAQRALDDYTGGLVRAHRDELAQANREVAAQRDRVLAAQAEAEALTRLVVHDLRNPLAALLQFVALAASRLGEPPGPVDAAALREVREDLRLAGEEGQRLAGMVDDLLLVSRLEHGGAAPRRQATPVAALLGQVAEAAAPRAADRQVRVEVSAEPDAMPAIDLDLVRRLVEHLLADALRFVDRGGLVELGARCGPGLLVVTVRHTGRPIPEAARPDLFSRNAPEALRQVHGQGLGLYLCRLVAEAHGGGLALVDAPGWPVCFEARLPLPPA